MSINTRSIEKFWQLQEQGRSVALDLDSAGVLAVRYTISNDAAKVEGVGTPPEPFPSCERVALCLRGVVHRP